MSRILHKTDWYEQLSPDALYEEEYERIIASLAESIFPSYWYTPFKKLLHSEDSSARPDFALVHKTYREWWLVEVELSSHSFEQHVGPQIRTLSSAEVGEDEAHYLKSQRSDLDLGHLLAMTKGEPPRVLVIVNSPVPSWASDLRRYGALVSVIEVFRSRYNRYVYRQNGDQLPESAVRQSRCTLELARMLRVHAPGILSADPNDSMTIQFGEGITEWKRLDIRDAVFLVASRPVSLSAEHDYVLQESEDGALKLTMNR